VPAVNDPTSSKRLAIVGSGPAGLAAAAAANALRPVILEAGPTLAQRTPDQPATIAQGVGGAGLFSDGKFSFWPSATHLWQLDRERLLLSYDFFRSMMPNYVPAPDLEFDRVANRNADTLKVYPSFYVTPDDRHQITTRLAALAADIEVNTEVTRISRAEPGWMVQTRSGRTVHADNLIVATGRFSLQAIDAELPSDSFVRRRLEVGVRIEQPADQFFLRDHPALDPKYIFHDAGGRFEWRTFCCCREGLVAPTLAAGLLTVSGRADCPATGMSNAGFNVRVTDPIMADELWRELQPKLRRVNEPIRQQLSQLLEPVPTGPLAELLGPLLTARLVEGLELLRHAVGRDALSAAVLVGPTLEGVVTYLAHDDRLSVPGLRGLWVAGDASGDFRGLTAALVSGHIAGQGVLMEGVS